VIDLQRALEEFRISSEVSEIPGCEMHFRFDAENSVSLAALRRK